MTSKMQRRGPGSRAGGNHPTRLELLDAAARLAGTEGLDALTVSAITVAAGHAKGTFYVHFDDRSQMIAELHRRFHDDLFSSIRARTADMAPGSERAQIRIEAFLDGCRSQPAVRAMLLEARSLPEIASLVEQRNAEAAESLTTDLRGLVAHASETARLLVSATVEVALQELTTNRRQPRLRAALSSFIPTEETSGTEE
jgi:TetR/AcrR family transcriptional repressor of nem operon